MRILLEFILVKAFILLTIVLTWSCGSGQNTEEQTNSIPEEVTYPRMIGDIAADSLLDDPDFILCNGDDRVVQYYALGEKTYEREKWASDKVFREQYKMPEIEDASGLIRVRFIINCEGKAGRFRLISMDTEYVEKEFDSRITDQILTITKSLDGWKIFKNKNQQPVEYYQYLIFKLKEGQLIEILP